MFGQSVLTFDHLSCHVRQDTRRLQYWAAKPNATGKVSDIVAQRPAPASQCAFAKTSVSTPTCFWRSHPESRAASSHTSSAPELCSLFAVSSSRYGVSPSSYHQGPCPSRTVVMRQDFFVEADELLEMLPGNAGSSSVYVPIYAGWPWDASKYLLNSRSSSDVNPDLGWSASFGFLGTCWMSCIQSTVHASQRDSSCPCHSSGGPLWCSSCAASGSDCHFSSPYPDCQRGWMDEDGGRMSEIICGNDGPAVGASLWEGCACAGHQCQATMDCGQHGTPYVVGSQGLRDGDKLTESTRGSKQALTSWGEGGAVPMT